MNADNIQLIDEPKIDDSIIKRDSINLYLLK